ncbi:DNA internalization-related competence protein ComEC/Rec2 [Marvinbryantia formatexigens]|uniref:DNA internalization-related competence protein ComEC/Rec2 n=1 Tax=Marvinbryantia formatexigens TaxID=168384 RepID=UPI0002F8443A|nr:DNA internalization-related competence protein ComEC/Rec2 [Marvinbryantia formatexigens]UWO24246.1 DNA internalization-related competence protein ComEC/Rec2 [Marvinbryantia formatexigens DSM 14469]SDF57873.1 competence protein ComEC [Marvinbryantia formatexigens]
MHERHLCCICCLLLLWFVLSGTFRGGTSGEDVRPAPEGDELTVSGTVYRQEFKQNSQRIYLKDISIESQAAGSSQKTSEYKNRIIVYLKEAQKIALGNRVRVSGVCTYLKEQRNPGGFDAKMYYSDMGVGMLLRKAELLWRDDRVYPLRNAISDFRLYARGLLKEAGVEADAGILSAMLLGDKGILDEEIKDLYADTGILHLLAISGLHVSMTGMALFGALRKLRVPFAGAAGVCAAVMAAYACMTGYPVSAVRAVLMFGMFLLAQVTGRTADSATSLALSAAAILLGKRQALHQAGFLLSFGAVGGILLANGWKSRLLKGTTLGMSLGVQIMTLPVTAYFYYQFPLYNVLVNLCVLPLMPFVLGFGMAGIAGAALNREAGRFLLAPAHYLLEAVRILCGKVRLLPLSGIVTGQPELCRLIVYYAALLLLLAFCGKFEKKPGIREKFVKTGKIDLIKCGAAIILLAGIFFVREPRPFSMTFLDVGQGDGCCIRNREHSVWMIDGGSSSEKNLAENCVEPFLKSSGAGRVDYWLISHYDEDHVSALLEILEGYERGLDGRNAAGITIGTLLLPEVDDTPELGQRLLALAEQQDIAVQFVGGGDVIRAGEMTVRVLAPQRGSVYENSNAASVVAAVEYGSFRALFTGDVEGTGEAQLLAEGLSGDVDVLKAAHHGSKNSTPMAFLAQTKPELTVISCGAGNSYGHPHKELLARLEESGSRVARTDLLGAVTVTVSGGGYTVTGHLSP